MPTENQKRLIALYSQMVTVGYETTENRHVTTVFSDMEIRKFRVAVRDLFLRFQIKSLLDYGCGGSDYKLGHFDGDKNAIEYFDLDEVYLFEPARQLDQRKQADAVVCFDVLEHIFIADIPDTVRELFSYARKLLIVNVANYPAIALLPNGENAHITVRTPEWWKGVFDTICLEYPEIQVKLWCSTQYGSAVEYPLFSSGDWLSSGTFVVNQEPSSFISLKQKKGLLRKLKEIVASIK
jgi:hypothetical protein